MRCGSGQQARLRSPRRPNIPPPISHPPFSPASGPGKGAPPSGPHESGAAAGGLLVSALPALRVRKSGGGCRRVKRRGYIGGWGGKAAGFAGLSSSAAGPLPRAGVPGYDPPSLQVSLRSGLSGPEAEPPTGGRLAAPIPFDYDLRSDETTR